MKFWKRQKDSELMAQLRFRRITPPTTPVGDTSARDQMLNIITDRIEHGQWVVNK